MEQEMQRMGKKKKKSALELELEELLKSAQASDVFLKTFKEKIGYKAGINSNTQTFAPPIMPSPSNIPHGTAKLLMKGAETEPKMSLVQRGEHTMGLPVRSFESTREKKSRESK